MPAKFSTFVDRYLWMPVCVLLLASLCSAVCSAQNVEPKTGAAPNQVAPPAVATTSLTGVVMDENSAVIAGAGVTVKDALRRSQKETVTASDGSFSFTELWAGSYVVTVRREGFSTAEVKDVMLKAGEPTALKVQLRVGDIGETVTVTADPLSDKAAATGLTLERQAIENFPINGRSLQTLTLLAPGTVTPRATFTEQGQLSVNGQRANANYFMLDGVSADIGVAVGASGTGQSGAGSLPGTSVMGSTNTLVSLDSLQEFKILTSAFAPEYGRTPGAQVLLTTRAGTNQFHGSVFEYFRSSAFGARDFFARAEDAELPSSRTHNFGGVFGGPVIKDRTFFFLSYEGLRAELPQFAVKDVPSMFARENSRPELQPILKAFPLPNRFDSSNNVAISQFASAYTDRASFDAASLRLDQKLGERLTLFARYNYAPSQIVERGAGSSLSNSLSLTFRTQTITLGATHIITPRLVNDFRVNYSRSTGVKAFTLDDFGGATPLTEAQMFPSFAAGGNSFYGFSLAGDSAAIFSGKDASSFQNQFNVLDNVALTLGSHQLKLGFDYRRLTSTYEEWKYRESASLTSNMTDLEIGSAASVSVSAQDRTAINFTNLSLYAQDTWRISQRLSVTYGLRWEYNPPPVAANGQSLFTVTSLDDLANLNLAPEGTPLYRATRNNYAPRLGAAFQLFRRPGLETMLRGGFGIFYDLGSGPLGNTASSFPYQRRKTFNNVLYPLDIIYTTPLPYNLSLPVSQIRVAEPNLQLPRVMEWNFGIEQSLGAKQTLTATYVGAAGRR
ncbi:MAG: TonB-dependent receptor, partial [Acidobacteria bacterium]|nr:TonB-dependent receptor [Acidobacteriota bacterium]